MKKIVKLTESDLTNIVKRVIKESAIKDSLIDMIKNDGWESAAELVGGIENLKRLVGIETLINMIKYDGWESAAELVGGIENLKRLVGIETPMDFLNIFTDLDVVESDEAPDSNLYRYEEGNNIMIYYRQRGSLYVNFKFTWLFLKEAFGLREVELEQLTQEWLNQAYNLNLRRIQIGRFSNPKFAKLT
jgi:hypothetical protein